MKKILFYISLVIGLALLFLFGKGNNINILAISSFDNNIGTLPIQIDIDNYDTYNKLDTIYLKRDNFYNNGVANSIFFEYGFTVESNSNWNGIRNNVGFYFNILNLGVEEGKTYTISFDITNNDFSYIKAGNERTGNVVQCTNKCYFTTIAGNYNNYVFYGMGGNNQNGYNTFTIENLMIYEGNYNSNLTFASYFKFGYILSGDIQLLCPSESVTQNISLLIFNNEDLLYKSNYFNGSSCGYIRFDNVYLPFNINNKGNVSFYLNLRFMIDGWGAGLYTLDYSSKLVLTPIYEAYYKGEFADDNIYTKLNYISNNIYYNGYNLEYSDGSTNLFYFLGNKNILGYNLSIEEAKFNKNVASDYLININNYNKFSFNNFLNFPLEIYLFSGNEDTTLMSMTSTNIYISFSSISSRVNNNQSTTTPLPDNELTIDKYNTCSAWYDIPCQLGNAVTYVIYEAPIISPIINFFDGLIEPIKQFIRLINQFSGFGILFGLGITAMLICIIKKMYGGGDS